MKNFNEKMSLNSNGMMGGNSTNSSGNYPSQDVVIQMEDPVDHSSAIIGSAAVGSALLVAGTIIKKVVKSKLKKNDEVIIDIEKGLREAEEGTKSENPATPKEDIKAEKAVPKEVSITIDPLDTTKYYPKRE